MKTLPLWFVRLLVLSRAFIIADGTVKFRWTMSDQRRVMRDEQLIWWGFSPSAVLGPFDLEYYYTRARVTGSNVSLNAYLKGMVHL